MTKTNKKPELLCPAGSFDAFRAAIEGGADAIYVGASSFNARMNAKNFSDEELAEAIKLAHAYGTKVYVTLNTLVYDKELDSFLASAEQAYLSGADALIVADIGAAELIHERIPIDLHASTQMSGHNVLAAKYLHDLGFTRMVAARELSREDLSTLTKESPIEIEAFVHGALCVCHSGQCLFSSLVGGRSGNRGECAQPCRLPFNGKNKYPLSLKDLSLAEHITELSDMGVASFKIEGRMKSPEYVRDVARIWRRLIDEGRNADKRDMARLCEIFSRGGLTDGYYTKRIDKGMLGIRSESDKSNSRALEPFSDIGRKNPIDMSAVVREGEPMSLTLKTDQKSVSVTGITPERAINAPLSVDAVKKNLTKLGGTPFAAQKVELDLSDDTIVPISAINKLRRDAIEALLGTNNRAKDDIKQIPISKGANSKKTVPKRSAYFHYAERIPDDAFDYFNIIYVPIESYNGSTNGAALPPVITDIDVARVREMIENARKMGCKHLLVGNIGHIALADGLDMDLHGDLRLNISNTQSARHFDRLLSDYILSPELTLPKIRDISRESEGAARVLIYGRVPLMVVEKCVTSEISDCRTCESGGARLIDRRGVTFPVAKTFEHRNIIFNSIPTYMADKKTVLKENGVIAEHFVFSNESKNEAANVIYAHKMGKSSQADVRRIKAQ